MSIAAAGAPADLAPLRQRLRDAGQEHLLTFEPTLDPARRQTLLSQIAALDLPAIQRLVREYVTARPAPAPAARIEPAPYYPLRPDDKLRPWDRAAYRAKGEALIADGKVAAFTVAGGQGSRLGYEGPKGCYPGGAVSGKPLFACLAEWILAAQRRYARDRGLVIPWYIMTSPGNHAQTVDFFHQHHHFGLRPDDVMFFPQGVMPAFDMATGHALLASPHELALAPDGHGGSLKALVASGAAADMRRRGVEHLAYCQIDNPLVRVIDPVFLGLHAFAPDSSGQMSSKMVPKAHAHEKVGVLCRVDGRTAVIEYSDLPPDLATRTRPDGALAFNAGSIAVHALSVAFLERLNAAGSGLALPWHRAEKKVPYHCVRANAPVSPDKPNAVKLETFVFDALPLCDASIVLETDRIEEFAPIKNASGPDSPESCAQIQTRRAARWLQAAGTRIPFTPDGQPQCTLELSPLRAFWPEDVRTMTPPPPAVVGVDAKVII